MEPRKIVLVVDDNPQNLQFLAELLDRNNYEPAVALNGKEALNYISERPDISAVLLDVMMPQMDGFETCKRIREIRQAEELPVIFLTALSDRTDLYKGFEAGGVDYITKPFDSVELIHRLDLHVELSLIRRSLADHVKELEEKNAELIELKSQLEKQANTDHMTGLHNRRSMSARIHEEIHRVRRYDGNFSLIFLDIDYFKKINDTYGHEAGDLVLKIFSNILKTVVRDGDLISRWGGEEFLALLLNSGTEEASKTAERIRNAIAEWNWEEVATDFSPSFTAGIVQCRDNEEFDDIIRRADKAMYRGKEEGRNRIIID